MRMIDRLGSFDPCATPSANDLCLRIPAEDPRRFGSDSCHMVADPIGHQVRFSPLGVPESLKSGEESPSSSSDTLMTQKRTLAAKLRLAAKIGEQASATFPQS
jgi:hypothetical protein